jgi:hypothetical protein
MYSVSNPVYTDTGIPVFGTSNTDTDTGKNLPVFAGICLYPILLVFTMQLAKKDSIFEVAAAVKQMPKICINYRPYLIT